MTQITESWPLSDRREQEMRTPDDVAEMCACGRAGLVLKRIARQLGCSHHTVKAYVAAGGVKPSAAARRFRSPFGLGTAVPSRRRSLESVGIG